MAVTDVTQKFKNMESNLEHLTHMNQRLLLVLGYGTAIMSELMREVGMRLNPTEEYKNEGYAWFLKCIENLVYLDKPLPPMP